MIDYITYFLQSNTYLHQPKLPACCDFCGPSAGSIHQKKGPRPVSIRKKRWCHSLEYFTILVEIGRHYQSLVVNTKTSGRIYINYRSIYLVSMGAQNTNWNKLRSIIIILLCHAKSLSYSPKRGAISVFELANFLTATNPRTLPEPCGEQTDAALPKSKSYCVIGHPLQLNLIVWVWIRIDRFSSHNNDLFTMKKQSKTYCIWQDVEITQKMRCLHALLQPSMRRIIGGHP